MTAKSRLNASFLSSTSFTPLLRVTFGDRQQVGTGAEQQWLAFDCANQFKNTASPRWISPARIEICREPARPFDGVNFHGGEAHFANLGLKFLGRVKESSGEVLRLACRIAVLPIAQIPFDDRCE